MVQLGPGQVSLDIAGEVGESLHDVARAHQRLRDRHWYAGGLEERARKFAEAAQRTEDPKTREQLQGAVQRLRQAAESGDRAALEKVLDESEPILRAAAPANEDARLAIAMFCYSVRKQVAAMNNGLIPVSQVAGLPDMIGDSMRPVLRNLMDGYTVTVDSLAQSVPVETDTSGGGSGSAACRRRAR